MRWTRSAWALVATMVAIGVIGGPGCGSEAPSPGGAGASGSGTPAASGDSGGGGGAPSGGSAANSGSTPAGGSGSALAVPDASAATGSTDAASPPDGPASTGDGSTAALAEAAVGAIDAGPPAARFVGRFDRTNPAGPRFAWPGSTVLARFTGSSIGVRLSGPTAYFDISIDGVMQPNPLIVSPAATSYPLATNLGAGPHELTVYRRSEAGIGGTGATTYLGVILDPAGGALLAPSPAPGRRIEIVGDSITTGYGDASTNGSCPDQLAAQDYDLAYGAVAARALGADLVTIAWTAKGMYRNSGGDMANTMPVLYGRTVPDQTTDTWDFTSWIPDAVVIYLGNNDFGRGDPGQPYVTTYNTFLARVRKNYPGALIVCTIGPNLHDPALGSERAYVKGIVLAQNAAGDKNVDFLEMPQPSASEGTGCGGHPLAVTHRRMADALVAELKTKLGW